MLLCELIGTEEEWKKKPCRRSSAPLCCHQDPTESPLSSSSTQQSQFHLSASPQRLEWDQLHLIQLTVANLTNWLESPDVDLDLDIQIGHSLLLRRHNAAGFLFQADAPVGAQHLASLE